MWFLVEGIRLYTATFYPFKFHAQNSIRRFKVFLLFGWLVPFLIVGIAVSVGFSLGIYMEPQPFYIQCHKHVEVFKYDRCWLAPGTPIFYATVFAPLALVLLINLFIVTKTIKLTFKTRRRIENRRENPEDISKAAKSFVLLLIMLGGTWSLAFFTGK